MTTQSPTNARVALVAARWHAEIVDRAVDAFERTLVAAGGPAVEVFHVPGAFEIPLHARRLAASGKYAAVAGCALVVDGGIYRHEFVAGSVVNALMRVQLDTDVPVFSAVLTPHHFHEQREHREFFGEHFVLKGQELADAVLRTLPALAKLG